MYIGRSMKVPPEQRNIVEQKEAEFEAGEAAGRLAMAQEIREMVAKRMKRNRSRCEALQPGQSVYGWTRERYADAVVENMNTLEAIDALIAKEEGK